MKESSFWSQRVRPYLAPWGFAQRIENALDAGTPDVFYCLGGASGWIENKYRAAAPARRSTRVFTGGCALRPQQIAWWRLYLQSGGRGSILAGVGRATYCFAATPKLIMGFNAMTRDDILPALVQDMNVLYQLIITQRRIVNVKNNQHRKAVA